MDANFCPKIWWGGEFCNFAALTNTIKNMKKLFLVCVAIIAAVAFIGCDKDEDSKFKYGDAIYGTWDITHIKQNDGSWLDITSSIFDRFHASATFNSDGTYSGSGYFGNGSGTYKASGSMIICYISGVEYAKYDVHSLSGELAEMTMTMDGDSVDIKCKKR